MHADADSSPPDFLVIIGDDTFAVTVTCLGPAPTATATGRVRRTRAQISAEAAAKRAALQIERELKATIRLAKKRAEAAAKQLRADERLKRAKAAMIKRIAADRKRRAAANKRAGIFQQKMTPKSETPRHVFAERREDDPDMSNWSHVVDVSTFGIEDALIGDIDSGDFTIADKVAFGIADDAELLVWIADQCGETVEWVIGMLLADTDNGEHNITTPEPLYDDTLLPSGTTRNRTKYGGGYCKSDVPSDKDRHLAEARRGNGWKAHDRSTQYA